MKTCIVWFRNDLRLHDHPALCEAIIKYDKVVPLFIFDEKLVQGRFSSANKWRFLLESLQDLKDQLQSIEADLVIRNGNTLEQLEDVVNEVNAEAVHYTIDTTPYARNRDKAVSQSLQEIDITFSGFPGRFIVDSFEGISTQKDKPYKVFTPFWKNWMQVKRRSPLATPKNIGFYQSVNVGSLPKLDELGSKNNLSPNVQKGGETAAKEQLETFINKHIGEYKNNQQILIGSTSELSAYLHMGCISPLFIESSLPSGTNPESYNRQLAWREFYHYVLLHFPNNHKQEFREDYRSLQWNDNDDHLQAWKDGKTGYPIVDAAMRQLKQKGWMHNRGRLIVGSFLTKDLQIDWREGEKYFMQMLIDGDQSSNNGNWQWIASVGVDPAPMTRRLYNPSSQHEKYDPDHEYVRKYVSELRNVPNKYMIEPWKMTSEEQKQCSCVIGKDYPAPIVDHASARKETIERYKAAKG